MKQLNELELNLISGGEFIHGWPTPDMMCLNTKLMVTDGRTVAGFDVSVAVQALTKYCHDDFWDPNVAHEFATTGGLP